MASSYIGKPCPKCAYVRTESDTAPDWQCPKCDIVYAKFGQSPPPRAPAPSAREAVHVGTAVAAEPESTGLAKVAHLATLANMLLPPLGTIVPVGIWVMKSGEDELAVDSAKEALNFQISTILWAVAVLLPVLVIPAFIFVSSIALVAIVIASLVMPIIATMRVADGVRYYYPYILHIFGDGPGPD
jgi:uncharacterized Tic20 family protein